MTDETTQAKAGLTDSERSEFESQYARRRKDPTIALILSLVLGAAGVDRFYVGDTGLGVAKLLTVGGLGVWALVDLFLIRGVANAKNTAATVEISEAIIANRS